MEEVERLAHAFAKLLERIEAERRRAGRLQLRAQEEERKRVARDLHDEVNQALTAILLRLEALTQVAPPRLRGGARGDEGAREPGDGGAAAAGAPAAAHRPRRPRLRPGDRGAAAAVQGPVRDRDARFRRTATWTTSGATSSSSSIASRRRRSTTSPATRGASNVAVEIARVDGHVDLEVADDGVGFDVGHELRGLGLDGMAERARLVEGRVRGRRRAGTRHDAPAAGPRLMIHALLADDHGIVRSGVRMLLDQQEGITRRRRGRGRRGRRRGGASSTSRTSPCSTSRCRA